MKPHFEIELDGIPETIDWLMYCSYAANREQSPHVSPDKWRALYFNQPIYEKIYRSFHEYQRSISCRD